MRFICTWFIFLLFSAFCPHLLFGQHELISRFEVRYDSNPLSTEQGYDYGGHLYLLSDNDFITSIDKTTGELGERQGVCRTVFDFDEALVSVSFDGVYRFDNGNWLLIKSFAEEMWFSYEPLSSQSDDIGYFTFQDAALWQTDGTPDGTFKLIDLPSNPELVELIGDSIHIVYGGETPTHSAYSLATMEFETHELPFGIANKTVHDNHVLLNGFSDQERPVYNLLTRNVDYLSTPQTGFRWHELKKIGDRYFGTNPNYEISTLAFLKYYYYWVDLEELTVSGLDSTDQLFRHGFSDLFSTENGLVMFKNEGDKGCEVYSVDDEFNSTLLKDIYPGMGSGLHHPYFGSSTFLLNFIKNPQSTSFDNHVYFSALSPTQGVELWRTDGTVEGTVRMTDFIEGASGHIWIRPLVIEGELYVLAHDGKYNSLYRINTDFAGYLDSDSPENNDQWTQYIFRDGTSYEGYHSPHKEPIL